MQLAKDLNKVITQLSYVYECAFVAKVGLIGRDSPTVRPSFIPVVIVADLLLVYIHDCRSFFKGVSSEAHVPFHFHIDTIRGPNA